jgi:hypothetical protein
MCASSERLSGRLRAKLPGFLEASSEEQGSETELTRTGISPLIIRSHGMSAIERTYRIDQQFARSFGLLDSADNPAEEVKQCICSEKRLRTPSPPQSLSDRRLAAAAP